MTLKYLCLFTSILIGLNNISKAEIHSSREADSMEIVFKKMIHLDSAKNAGFENRLQTVLENLTRYYVGTDCQKSIQYAEHLLKLIRKQKTKNIENKNNLLGDYYNIIGINYMYLSKYKLSIENYMKAQHFFEKTGKEQKLNSVFINLGLVFLQLSDYPKSLEYQFKALKLKEKFKDMKGIANAYSSIGGVYYSDNKPDLALEYFEKALAINNDIKNENGISVTLNNIANIYSDKGRNFNDTMYLNKAITYYFKSLEIDIKSGDKSNLSAGYSNLGCVYRTLKNYDTAYSYLMKALDYRLKLKDNGGLSISYNNLGKLYADQKDWKQAIVYYKKAVVISQEIGTWDNLYINAMELSFCYAQLEDYRNAYTYNQMFIQYKDSVTNDNRSNEIGRIEMGYEMEKKFENQKRQEEKAMELLRIEKTRIFNLQYLIAFIIILIIFIMVFNLSRISLSKRFIDATIFLSFLLFFEFIQVYLDPFSNQLTDGNPLPMLGINSFLAIIFTGIHSFFSVKLKMTLLKKQKN